MTDYAKNHMRLLILTYGTEGDSRPLAALGHALMQAGHAVRLLADASTLDTARALGVPCDALAGDIRATLAREHGMREITRALPALVDAHASEWLQQAIETGRGCDAMIVSGLTAFVGLSAAEALRVPVIGTMLIPITPTKEFAAPFLPFDPPRVFNRASHHLFNQLTWAMLRKSTNQARARVGLPQRRGLWSGHPMLYGVSPALLSPPADWPANAHLTGQWIPPAAAWAPPQELEDYLNAGEPPIYVGFGSMAGFDTTRVLEAVTGAVGERRVLFNGGWSGIDTARLPPNFHPIGNVPHDWLMPRCALAIHHGGSGTTHSTCRAGIPGVIVPFAGDQFFWGARLRRAGVMQHVLAGKSITSVQLRDAIAHASSADAKAHAAQLGERMRHEHGCRAAVGLVERYAVGS